MAAKNAAAAPAFDTVPIHPRFQTFVINLDRSPDRLSAMGQRLSRAGLPWIRVPAIDGSTLDLSCTPEVDSTGYRRNHGKHLNAAEVGCYLSHVRALREFLSGPWSWALVLEDDADFPDDFQHLLSRLISLNDEWDVVKLSSFHSGTPVRIEDLSEHYALAVPLSRLMNSNSILFNRRAAEVLVERLLPMQLPYDHALERAWLFGLKLRTVTPSPCPSDTNLVSTIGDRQRLKLFKLRWYRRGPAMIFRARTELMRVYFGGVHALHAHSSRLRWGTIGRVLRMPIAWIAIGLVALLSMASDL
nr:glycosyltransferase family 25 protein [Variovorax dokdonensis]